MEVHALRLSLFERDLNDLLDKYLPQDQPIEELTIHIDAKGLRISGVYPLFINVHFETHWTLGLDQGQVSARLTNFKAMGVPGNIFKSAIVKMIEDLAGSEQWIRIHGDTLWVDVDGCLEKFAFACKSHFKALQCRPGEILITGAEG